MLTALNLELPVGWDSLGADRARVQVKVWVPVAVRVWLRLWWVRLRVHESSSMHDLHRACLGSY